MLGLRTGVAIAVVSLAFVSAAGGTMLLACGGSTFTTATDAGSSPADSGAALTFCQTDGAHFDFCADFDEPLPGPWSVVSQPTGGASVMEDTQTSTSPPASLLASAPEVDLDGAARPNVNTILTKTNLPKGTTHIAFDFQIDELSFPNSSDVSALVVALAYTQGTYGVLLGFRAVAADMAPFDPWLLETVTAPGTTSPVVTGLSSLHGLLSNVGVWTHVAIDFDVDTATILPGDGGLTEQGTITVTGQPPKIVTLHPPPGAAGVGARALWVGVSSTAAAGAAKLRFDNVTYGAE